MEYKIEYYSSIKKKGLLSFVATWMDLEGIILNEISQIKKDILYDLSYM